MSYQDRHSPRQADAGEEVSEVAQKPEQVPHVDALAPLLEEMRALFGILPGAHVAPEADEADFDNMPV